MREHDPVRRYAQSVLRGFDETFEILDITATGISRIVKARTHGFGTVCLKISARVFAENANSAPKRFLGKEIEAFELIGDAPWAPRMFAHAEDGAWLIREWIGDATVDTHRQSFWTPELLRDFWRYMKEVLEFFHLRDDPIVIRDLKPKNITFADGRFCYFDFSAANSIDVLRLGVIPPRIGTGSSRYLAPELLYGECERISTRLDYFPFATLMAKFITGRLLWTNSAAGLEASRARYLEEYRAGTALLERRMRTRRFSDADIVFLSACLHPDPDRRPAALQLPTA